MTLSEVEDEILSGCKNVGIQETLEGDAEKIMSPQRSSSQLGKRRLDTFV